MQPGCISARRWFPELDSMILLMCSLLIPGDAACSAAMQLDALATEGSKRRSRTREGVGSSISVLHICATHLLQAKSMASGCHAPPPLGQGPDS